MQLGPGGAQNQQGSRLHLLILPLYILEQAARGRVTLPVPRILKPVAHHPHLDSSLGLKADGGTERVSSGHEDDIPVCISCHECQ